MFFILWHRLTYITSVTIPDSSSSSNGSNSVVPIAAGVACGVLALIIAILIVLLLRRRKRRRGAQYVIDDTPVNYQPATEGTHQTTPFNPYLSGITDASAHDSYPPGQMRQGSESRLLSQYSGHSSQRDTMSSGSYPMGSFGTREGPNMASGSTSTSGPSQSSRFVVSNAENSGQVHNAPHSKGPIPGASAEEAVPPPPPYA